MEATNTLQTEVIQEQITACQIEIARYENSLRANAKNHSEMTKGILNNMIQKERIKLRIWLQAAAEETE